MLIYTKKVTILIAIVVVCTLGSLPASASAVPVHVSPLKSVSLAPSVNCKGMSIRACENASAAQARANAAAAQARANAAAEARQAAADQARANQAATQAAAQREANQAAANQARIVQAQAEARQAAADQARADAASKVPAAKVPAVTIPASIAVPMIFSPIVALTPSVGAGVTQNLGTGIVYEELMPNTYGNNSTTLCTTKSPAAACSPIRQNNAANAEQNFKVIVDTIGEYANSKPIVTVTGYSNYKCEEWSAGKNIACGGASARDRANDAANVTKASLAKENPPVTSTIVSNASMCAAIKTQVCLVTASEFDKGEKVAADFAITLPNATTTCCVTPTTTVPVTGTPIATPTNGTPIATPTNGTPIVTPTNGTPIVTPTNGTPDNSGGANNNSGDPSNGSAGSAGSAPDFSEYPEAINPDTGEPWVVSLLVDVKVPANYIANGKKTALTATVTILCGGSPCRSNSLIDSKYETVTMSQKVETGLCSRPTQLNCLYYAPENGKKQVSPATYTMYFYTPSPSARQITTTLSVDAVITRIIPRKDGSAVTVSIDNYRIVYRANGVGASSEISRPVLGSRG